MTSLYWGMCRIGLSYFPSNVRYSCFGLRQNIAENYLTPLSDDRKIKAKEEKQNHLELGN